MKKITRLFSSNLFKEIAKLESQLKEAVSSKQTLAG